MSKVHACLEQFVQRDESTLFHHFVIPHLGGNILNVSILNDIFVANKYSKPFQWQEYTMHDVSMLQSQMIIAKDQLSRSFFQLLTFSNT